MHKARERLEDIYQRLYTYFGPQHWWPAENAFEVIIGAILTQNTAWRNVEKAISNLKRHGALSIQKLKNMQHARLAKLIKPTGYYNQKTKKLKNFLYFLCNEYKGSLNKMFCEDASTLRNKLLEVNGIGPETADSILLYAGNKPIFVIDAYTRRVFSRHRFIKGDEPYVYIQQHIMNSLKHDTRIFNEYHALIVRLGKEFCKTKPACMYCPLKDIKK